MTQIFEAWGWGEGERGGEQLETTQNMRGKERVCICVRVSSLKNGEEASKNRKGESRRKSTKLEVE
jgi:hypothetical protein